MTKIAGFETSFLDFRKFESLGFAVTGFDIV
jgi:hypothetical protein